MIDRPITCGSHWRDRLVAMSRLGRRGVVWIRWLGLPIAVVALIVTAPAAALSARTNVGEQRPTRPVAASPKCVKLQQGVAKLTEQRQRSEALASRLRQRIARARARGRSMLVQSLEHRLSLLVAYHRFLVAKIASIRRACPST